MIDDENVDRRFSEIVVNYNISESRIQKITKISTAIGAATLMAVSPVVFNTCITICNTFNEGFRQL